MVAGDPRDPGGRKSSNGAVRGGSPGRGRVQRGARRARNDRRFSTPPPHPAAMTSVLVIIVNYNTAKLARRCLQSVASELADVEWEGVVVDNASPDGGIGTLQGIPRV